MNENNHGGARPRAGRKTKYEKTVVMRVPEKYKDCIKELIKHLDETAYLNKDYPTVSSDGFLIRSLDDKRQKIIFMTEPQ
ncbi:hypothetical protein [Shewanella sp. NFH-SH190041]|uniref:hypothetical protein n=1 Tax=Shewanella sp. NFH-SH190041 TaxID=2950245 RepID=UPI0021C34689|nr:hypothetical protein [Shewanella sp. NFH-SH190041]